MKRVKILVVEDDEFTYKLIFRYLSKDYFICGNAVSTEEALKCYREMKPDVIIMDINLEGGLDGIHASEMINAIRVVPVIYITGTETEDLEILKQRIIASHPYAFLRKPLNLEELKMIVELSYEKFLAERKLHTANRRLEKLSKAAIKDQFVIQTALEGGNILVWEYNLINGQYMISGNWLKQLAVNRDNALTQTVAYSDWEACIYEPDVMKIEKTMQDMLIKDENSFETEYRVLSVDSHYLWILTKGKVFEHRKGKASKLIGTHVNISERKNVEKKLEAFASLDPLTKTYNRKMGIRYLNHQILKAKKGNVPLTAAYVDIDNLKHVNDTYGHDMGDELIRQIITILRMCLRETDIISRFGGDEFLLIFSNCDIENAGKIMRRITDEINLENLDGLYPFFLGISYGIEQYDESVSGSSDDYIKHLDSLMYLHKNEKH
jgi:diguanylate cyclase (GGDEF)-like protein